MFNRAEQCTALCFTSPVPAGKVGVLSLFTHAVFMATKSRKWVKI